MSISQSLLPEFDQEMANTRRMLELVPDDKVDWKPHAKSMSIGQLAEHIASLADWAVVTLETESFDPTPVDGPAYQMPQLKTRAEMLAYFDRKIPEARTKLAAASDQAMMTMWSLNMGGKNIFRMPRVATLRSMFMNHVIHHRAQLQVFLRLNDIPVPGMYGPSADEPQTF